MPVEIREIIIRAIVQEEKNTTVVSGSPIELLQKSVEQVVTKIIEKKKER